MFPSPLPPDDLILATHSTDVPLDFDENREILLTTEKDLGSSLFNVEVSKSNTKNKFFIATEKINAGDNTEMYMIELSDTNMAELQ